MGSQASDQIPGKTRKEKALAAEQKLFKDTLYAASASSSILSFLSCPNCPDLICEPGSMERDNEPLEGAIRHKAEKRLVSHCRSLPFHRGPAPLHPQTDVELPSQAAPGTQPLACAAQRSLLASLRSPSPLGSVVFARLFCILLPPRGAGQPGSQPVPRRCPICTHPASPPVKHSSGWLESPAIYKKELFKLLF